MHLYDCKSLLRLTKNRCVREPRVTARIGWHGVEQITGFSFTFNVFPLREPSEEERGRYRFAAHSPRP